MMSNSDPQNGFFYSYVTPVKDSFNYTPDIRSMWGYIVLAFPFLRSFIRSYVRSFVTGSKFLR